MFFSHPALYVYARDDDCSSNTMSVLPIYVVVGSMVSIKRTSSVLLLVLFCHAVKAVCLHFSSTHVFLSFLLSSFKSNQLFAMFEMKPPISRAKMISVTKSALRAVKVNTASTVILRNS